MAERRADRSGYDEVLLASLDDLRVTTRRRRHAFWLPLLVFGVLICAAAPLYTWTSGPTSGHILLLGGQPPLKPVLFALGGNDRALGRDSTAATRGWYWLAVLLIGALVTGLWYSWYARVVGIATRARLAVVSWIAATIGLIAVSSTSWSSAMVAWPTTFFATSALFVVAIGLVALAASERSPLMTIVTASFTAMTALCTFHDIAGMVLRLLSRMGLSDADEPYSTSGALVVVLPGLTLIVGALVMLRQDRALR